MPSFAEDVLLDPTIRFDQPLSKHLQSPKAIFLTGATGFIGAFLLDELIQKTTATIYCLVRSSEQQALERLKSQLQYYGLWQANYNERIIVINGDLSQPCFGLSDAQFYRLAEKIDLIYHSAALMNPFDSYQQMKGINVLGTQEVIRLAALAQTKPIHYISTLGVFSNSYNDLKRPLTETELPVYDEGLSSGYSQSKWVAEQLLRTAKEQGCPVSIYRPDIVLGHSQTGAISPAGHFLCNVLLASIQCGSFPTIETMINFVPVDYVSRAVVYLSMQQGTDGKTFHLDNPQPVLWQQLWTEIEALSYPVKQVTYEQWCADVIALSMKHPDNIKLAIVRKRLESGKSIYLFSDKPIVDSSHTRQGLSASDIVCPAIDRHLLSVYLNYFQSLKNAYEVRT